MNNDFFTTLQPQHFNPQTLNCVCYLEVDNRILTLPNQTKQWDLPSDKLLDQEEPTSAALRILQDQLHVVPNKQDLTSYRICYTNLPGTNSIFFLFHCTLHQIPDHLASAAWVSTFAYRFLHFIQGNAIDLTAPPPKDGRIQAFEIMYQDRIWHPMVISENTPSSSLSSHRIGTLVLQKGDQIIEFNPNMRLFVLLIGIAASGKKTQSLLLEKALGISSTSSRELYHSASDNMKQLISLYSIKFEGKSVPDEISLGLMAQRLIQSDCLSGITLRGFPLTKTHCEAMFKLFTRSIDTLIPIYLKIDGDVSSRISPDQQNRARSRTEMFHSHLPEVCQILNPHTLSLPTTMAIADVFHFIFQSVQNRLDQKAMQQHNMNQLQFEQANYKRQCEEMKREIDSLKEEKKALTLDKQIISDQLERKQEQERARVLHSPDVHINMEAGERSPLMGNGQSSGNSGGSWSCTLL